MKHRSVVQISCYVVADKHGRKERLYRNIFGPNQVSSKLFGNRREDRSKPTRPTNCGDQRPGAKKVDTKYEA